MGSQTEDGESPVDERAMNLAEIQSTARHEKPGRKQGGPPPKAKYGLVTDSEEVLWRKGEKNPGRGVKKNLKSCAYKQTEGNWRRTFCRTVQRVNA